MPSVMQVCDIVKLFPNLASLDLTQHNEFTRPEDSQADFQQLTALKRLTSLKMFEDWNCNLLRQVPSYPLVHKQYSACKPLSRCQRLT